MLEKIVSAALAKKGLVIIVAIGVSIIGAIEYRNMPIDAFPDISPVMVPIFAEAHGMAPEEIERLIAYPIETAMNGLPDVAKIKSTSAFGMAVVYVYFKDDVDIYFARQLVSERLASAAAALPEMHETPILGPISTGLGQIFMYYLILEDGAPTNGLEPGTYLRDLNDWVVKQQLQTVPGVTEILSMGGHVLQYQIKLDPVELQRYGLEMESVIEAVRANNKNVGGQFMVLGSEEYLIRGVGLLPDLNSISRIPIKMVDGTSIVVSDVASVEYGNEVRRGAVTLNGKQEVVAGIVMKLYGENTSDVISNLYKKVDAVTRGLPKGVKLVPFYEQAELIDKAVGTVRTSLLIGAGLVILVLFLFMGEVRSAAIVALALPLCALAAFIGMRAAGISANLMSLGGIAIGIGMLGDGAIVMVENIQRRLGSVTGSAAREEAVLAGAKEVVRPIVFSIIIIIIVFLPIFTLESIEGKMFSPMAFSIAFALLGSIYVAVVVSPVLSSLLLKGEAGSSRLNSMLKRAYRPLLEAALKRRRLTIVGAVIILAASLSMVPLLGTEFIPTLEEGSIQIGVMNAPSVSLEKNTKTISHLERIIIKHPEVDEVISRIGRPEAGSHPHPVNYSEIHIELKPASMWPKGKTKQDLITELDKELGGYPGVQLNFSQPIQNMFDELLSGVKAQLAIKVMGEDLDVLREKAADIQEAIEDIDGLVDLSSEQSYGQPQIRIIPDRDACSRLGVSVDHLMEIVEIAIGGEVIDDMYLGTRRYGIHVRYKEKYRSDPQVIGDILVETPSGPHPLSDLAMITRMSGPIQINREDNQRRWIVQGNFRGRDLGSIFSDVKANIAKKVKLPPGYFIEYGGQFENQRRAMNRLAIIVPAVIGCILLLLWVALSSFKNALIIVVNVPLALIGGIVGLWLSGEYLSVPASVGFIALFGIAVQNGMVLVTCINQLRDAGSGLLSAIVEGGMLRLRPVLMTALTTVLGLTPLLLSSGIGSEVQRPLALVVVSGLITSTILTLFVLPVVYYVFFDKAELSDAPR